MDTTTTLGDQFVSEVVSEEFLLTIGDRNSLPEHPALMYLGAMDGSGSDTKKVPHVALGGVEQPDPIAEGADAAVGSITDSSSTVAIARYTKGYETSDAVRMLQNVDRVGFQPLSVDALLAYMMRLTNLIANVIDDFTTQAGPGTGNDLTVASVLAANGALAVNNVPANGGYMGVMHGQQWSDLITNGGTGLSGGTQERNPELARISVLHGESFKGMWLGVDWYVSNQVATANAGADRAGAIFGRGGVLWADGRHGGVDLDLMNQFLIGEGRVLFERVRNGRGAETAYLSHGYLGASLGTQAGITLISDA